MLGSVRGDDLESNRNTASQYDENSKRLYFYTKLIKLIE